MSTAVPRAAASTRLASRRSILNSTPPLVQVEPTLLPVNSCPTGLLPGEPADPNAKRIGNGIIGDARRSSAEIGKHIVDIKVQCAVEQIHKLLGAANAASTQ